MLTQEEAYKLLSSVSLVRSADMLPSGYLRLETPFKYPDGTSIDVFVEPKALLPEIRLSDLGQTTGWLLNLQMKPWLSRKRRALVDDALSTYGVAQSGGELVLDIPEAAALPDGIIRLSQACLRVADLSFTRRSSLQSSFLEEVEEVLDDSELSYTANAEVLGKFGNVVRVDFSVEGRRSKSLVLTLGSQNPSAAHTLANEVFKRWHYLNVSARPEQRVTLFDDRSSVYRDEDLKALEEVSTVLPFSDRNGVRELLAA